MGVHRGVVTRGRVHDRARKDVARVVDAARALRDDDHVRVDRDEHERDGRDRVVGRARRCVDGRARTMGDAGDGGRDGDARVQREGRRRRRARWGRARGKGWGRRIFYRRSVHRARAGDEDGRRRWSDGVTWKPYGWEKPRSAFARGRSEARTDDGVSFIASSFRRDASEFDAQGGEAATTSP